MSTSILKPWKLSSRIPNALVFYGAPMKLVKFAGMGLLIAGMYLMGG